MKKKCLLRREKLMKGALLRFRSIANRINIDTHSRTFVQIIVKIGQRSLYCLCNVFLNKVDNSVRIKVCELWPSWDPLGSRTWVSILWNFTARCRKKRIFFFVSLGEWIEWIGLQQRIDVTVHVCGVHTVEPPCILRALKHGIATIRRIHNCVTHPAIYKCLEPFL